MDLGVLVTNKQKAKLQKSVRDAVAHFCSELQKAVIDVAEDIIDSAVGKATDSEKPKAAKQKRGRPPKRRTLGEVDENGNVIRPRVSKKAA